MLLRHYKIIGALALTFVLVGSAFVAYRLFATPIARKLDTYSVQYLSYTPTHELHIADVSSLQDANAVPVLMYHGVTRKEDAENTTIKNFIAQMEILKENGFETITVHDFDLWREGKFKLPKKPIIITFDDGRKDSYYPTDDVFKKLGFKATMFLATGPLRDGNQFYLTEEELKVMKETGRWEFEAHGRYSHNKIPVSSSISAEKGRYLASKEYLVQEGRLETDQEFYDRVFADYVNANNDMSNIFGYAPQYLAIPLNDYGNDQNSNYSAAVGINNTIVKSFYKIAFIQANDSEDVLDVVNSPFNYSYEDPYITRRLEMKNMTADELISILYKYDHYNPIPFSLSQESFNSINQSRVNGIFQIVDNEFVLSSKATDEIGSFSVLESYSNRYTSTVRFDKNDTASVSVFGHMKDSKNYVACGYSGKSFFLREFDNDVQYALAPDGVVDVQVSGPQEISLTLTPAIATCSYNGKIMFKNVRIHVGYGTTGVKIWDPHQSAELLVRSFDVKK